MCDEVSERNNDYEKGNAGNTTRTRNRSRVRIGDKHKEKYVRGDKLGKE